MPTQPARVQVPLRDIATARKLHKVRCGCSPACEITVHVPHPSKSVDGQKLHLAVTGAAKLLLRCRACASKDICSQGGHPLVALTILLQYACWH